MAAAEPAPWSLELRHSGIRTPSMIRFHMPGECDLEVTFTSGYLLIGDAMDELRESPHLGGLHSLRIEGDALSQILGARTDLPAVQELTIVDSGAFDASAIRMGLLDASILQHTLIVPALQSVVFVSRDPPVPSRRAVTTLSRLADCISTCFEFNAEKLRSITIVQSTPSENDIRMLLAIAQHVYLDDGATKRPLDAPEDQGGWPHSLCALTD
ncbi:hypothetical protein AURDEDRAFT_174157 [Auricularia subglabra TFB-10046 SS5]|nr:hypothetical protein AURDEDRAFT_174157 [Auricularia subglabra TFB-10046 SS5]